ncbi:Cyclic di-GMP phosphodiesterase YahA [Anoxybacillus sp. P3H1B]|uniref:EAL and HDOD domain-containing protein n=1 Tax=Anoxybacillus sp. P3H1B TaxID=1769293 RepID=UPI00079AB3D3|nr:EAL domain-containing protein [Anoxybacillus sp. P3H1B]KXG08899.1 Cyclic di-GMP phosphodiesterase YahA [Anoxybacillus sp. P3H1B]
MDIYVGRQPILNKKYELFGYELLYRSGEQNFYDSIDGDHATIDVLINSFMNIGIEKLTNGARCFINFTEKLLEKNIPLYFPNKLIVVEILETIPYSEKLLHICKNLKEKGYIIALDDFVFQADYHPLFPYIDFIKIDFFDLNIEQARYIQNIIKQYNIQFIAEKVETHDQLQLATHHGFSYFQGYFFNKPVVLKEKSLPKITNTSRLTLLKQMNQAEFNFDKIVKTIENDPALAYRLLKVVNSFFLYSSPKIKSIRHAAILLGASYLRSWLTILTFQEASNPFENEVIVNSLIRAKMLEQVAVRLNIHEEKDSLFFMGICSSLHILLERPLSDILDELNVDEAIKDGLFKEKHLFFGLYQFVLAIELNDLMKAKQLAEELGLSLSEALLWYQQCIEWVVQLQRNSVNSEQR